MENDLGSKIIHNLHGGEKGGEKGRGVKKYGEREKDRDRKPGGAH